VGRLPGSLVRSSSLCEACVIWRKNSTLYRCWREESGEVDPGPPAIIVEGECGRSRVPCHRNHRPFGVAWVQIKFRYADFTSTSLVFGRTTSGEFWIWSHQVLVLSRTRFWYFQGNQSHLLLESHTCRSRPVIFQKATAAVRNRKPLYRSQRQRGLSHACNTGRQRFSKCEEPVSDCPVHEKTEQTLFPGVVMRSSPRYVCFFARDDKGSFT
jgi:hypothetical protein